MLGDIGLVRHASFTDPICDAIYLFFPCFQCLILLTGFLIESVSGSRSCSFLVTILQQAHLLPTRSHRNNRNNTQVLFGLRPADMSIHTPMTFSHMCKQSEDRSHANPLNITTSKNCDIFHAEVSTATITM